jgi:DNA-binding response OmpR family regulator
VSGDRAAGPLVLLIEDEPQMCRFLRTALSANDYRLVEAPTAREGLAQAAGRSPDVVLLDLGLPDRDGLDVARELRGWSAVPIIVLSARGREQDKVAALDLGADDYLTKPYNPRELVARVRTVLRRTRSRAEGEVYRVGELEIDPVRHEVRLAGRLVEATPAEFKILACLAASPGRAFSRQQLLEHAFGFDHYVFDRTIDVHVMNLRKKIEPSPGTPAYLKTVYGVGYKLADKVVTSDAS